MADYYTMLDGHIQRATDGAMFEQAPQNADYLQYLADVQGGATVVPFDYEAEAVRCAHGEILEQITAIEAANPVTVRGHREYMLINKAVIDAYKQAIVLLSSISAALSAQQAPDPLELATLAALAAQIAAVNFDVPGIIQMQDCEAQIQALREQL